MRREIPLLGACILAAGACAISLLINRDQESVEPIRASKPPESNLAEEMIDAVVEAVVEALPVVATITGETAPQRADRRAGSDRASIEARVTIDRSPHDVYAFWRRLENLPIVLRFLRSVEEIDDARSRWTLRGAAASTISWDCEIALDAPDAEISWRSLPNEAVQSRCTVRFIPTADATELHLQLHVAVTQAAASADAPDFEVRASDFFGDAPSKLVEEDLQRLRISLESGAFARFGKGASE